MLFEYIQGGELFSRLTKNGRFNNDTALFYVAGDFGCDYSFTFQGYCV
jgi:hypothetical protein